MANLTETSTFPAGVYQLETTDPVLAGADGIANLQAQQLANRTRFLNDQISALTTQIAALQRRLIGSVQYLSYDVGATDLWTDPDGWLWFVPRGASIGSSTSTALLANNKLQQLYNVLWTTPAYTVTGGKGASANADWTAGRPLLIPDMRGRTVVMSGMATGGTASRAVGSVFGAETLTLSTANLPVHSHRLSMSGFTATGLVSSGATGVAAVTYGAQTIALNQPNAVGNRSASNDNLGAIGDTGSGTAIPLAEPAKAYSEIWFTGSRA